jgi:uncharacterized protein with von Willebrand factor type A (vWA) domain
VPYGGFLFDPKWKDRKLNRPDVLVICDISRSMMRLVRFFLLFLYGLNEEILRIRTFVFCSNLIDVSDVFERYPVEEAVDRLQQGTELPLVMGLTDYARSLKDSVAIPGRRDQADDRPVLGDGGTTTPTRTPASFGRSTSGAGASSG